MVQISVGLMILKSISQKTHLGKLGFGRNKKKKKKHQLIHFSTEIILESLRTSSKCFFQIELFSKIFPEKDLKNS